MIVCICHGVSDRAIAEAAARGCSFDEMQLELRVATACSGCLEYAKAVFHQRAGAYASSACTPLGKRAGGPSSAAPPAAPDSEPNRPGE